MSATVTTDPTSAPVRIQPRGGPQPPRVFFLWRTKDPSGVSGTGCVAWGVEWPDGHAATQWSGDRYGIAQITEWERVQDILTIHGHGGATELRYLGPLVCDSCLTIQPSHRGESGTPDRMR
ncbi:hypothetical protein GCM10009765_23190 [Fodinicola feengrottensis]|uniref:Uncharacterized protein n=1 Tax=Fodinicola feengrottensis TaxID=435914 RepID=A0ABN2GLW3_9ACTN